MTSITASHDAPHSERVEFTKWTARRNRETQRRLFQKIIAATAQSGREAHEVAASLGVDEDTLAAVVRGETDLTLTELRLLSIACDVVIDYRVTPAADDMDSHVQILLRALRRDIEAKSSWNSESPAHLAAVWQKR